MCETENGSAYKQIICEKGPLIGLATAAEPDSIAEHRIRQWIIWQLGTISCLFFRLTWSDEVAGWKFLSALHASNGQG